MKNTHQDNRKFPLKRTFLSIIISLLLFSSACDFENPADFELPTWFVDIQVPLVNERYPLSDIVNDSTIFANGDTIQIQFGGALDTQFVDPSFLKINFDTSLVFSENFTAPNDESFEGDSVIISIVVNFGDFLGINFPLSSDTSIPSSLWNTIVEQAIISADTSFALDYDISGGQDLPFTLTVDTLIMDTTSGANEFYTEIYNWGLPKAITGINIELWSGSNNNITAMQWDTLKPPDLPVIPNYWYNWGNNADNKDIGGKKLTDSLRIVYAMGFESVANPDSERTVIIHAGSEFKAELLIKLKITDLSSAVVSITDAENIAPEIEPLKFNLTQEQSSKCKVLGIYQGIFNNATGDTNIIQVTDVLHTYPFDILFKIFFPNFVPDTTKPNEVVGTERNLVTGEEWAGNNFDLSNKFFYQPDGSGPIEFLNVELVASVDDQTITISLNENQEWGFNTTIAVKPLNFESLTADLDCDFPTQSQEIVGIPQGFSGMSFEDVILSFTIYNQIKLPLCLNLNLSGISNSGATVTVPITTQLAQPSADDNFSTTIVLLDRLGTHVTVVSGDTSEAVCQTSASGGNIVELLNLNPSEINIDVAASVIGVGQISQNDSLWGEFELVVPFYVKLDEMTFIPVTKTSIGEMDHSTRNSIRSSLSQAEIATQIVNHIPVGGEISILHSNNTLFPLDTTDIMLSAFRDSMVVRAGWSYTDSLYILTNCEAFNLDSGNVYIFNVMDDYSKCIDGLIYLVRSTGSAVDTIISYIDTVGKFILPDPLELFPPDSIGENPGSVSIPGELTYVTSVNGDKIRLLTEYGDHYIVPRIHLNGSPVVAGDTLPVFLSYSDYIDIQSTITFRISSTGMLEEPEDELVVLYPNGGETLYLDNIYTIRWKTFGNISRVDIHFDANNDGNWKPITTEIANVDSFIWAPVLTPGIVSSDSVKIRISDSDSGVEDMSGWYFRLIQQVLEKEVVENNTTEKMIRPKLSLIK